MIEFSDEEIRLMETRAEIAVVTGENTRLLNEYMRAHGIEEETLSVTFAPREEETGG